MDKKKNPVDVDDYIAGFSKEIQKSLKLIRAAIKKAAPKAEEGISYQMPAYKYLGRPLIYFAGYDHHIGIYPTPSGIEEFKKELSVYKGAKGSVQFPLHEPMPLELITRIVKFRLKENEEKSSKKKPENLQ